MKSTIPQARILNSARPAPAAPAGSWYSIRAAANQQPGIEIDIFGDIGDYGITAAEFATALKVLDDGISPVRVRIDSDGGDLFDGIAMHNLMRSLGERCTARIEGACLSAASVAASGAHRVEMADNALYMIHNPWAGYVSGDSAELRTIADMLDAGLEAIVTSYQHRALTVDDAELRRMIDATTWMTAAEALAHGFIDSVTGSAAAAPRHAAAAGRILNSYRNAPAAARALCAPDPAPEPAPEPAPAPAPDPAPDAAALAAQLASDCAAAGISAHMPALIRAHGLRDAATLKAAVTQAAAIQSACALARQPQAAAGLIESGTTLDQARLHLWDALADTAAAVELDNSLPVDALPQNHAYQPPAPGDVYAKRRATASKGAHA